jgi:DNA-binding response OmpR family regulator
MSQPLNLIDLDAERDARQSRSLENSYRPRMLIVDDEPMVGRIMAHAAEECGVAATAAISANGFKSQYEADPPDLVLLDLSLPGGDGIELLRFLARKKSQALILIASGFDRRVVEAARRLGRELGLRMGDALTKPVRVHELGEAIDGVRRQYANGGEGDVGACLAS